MSRCRRPIITLGENSPTSGLIEQVVKGRKPVGVTAVPKVLSLAMPRALSDPKRSGVVTFGPGNDLLYWRSESVDASSAARLPPRVGFVETAGCQSPVATRRTASLSE